MSEGYFSEEKKVFSSFPYDSNGFNIQEWKVAKVEKAEGDVEP